MRRQFRVRSHDCPRALTDCLKLDHRGGGIQADTDLMEQLGELDTGKGRACTPDSVEGELSRSHFPERPRWIEGASDTAGRGPEPANPSRVQL